MSLTPPARRRPSTGPDVLDVPTSPVPPAVASARGLLLAVSRDDVDPFTRLAASAALARLCDVTPPYPPSTPAEVTLRGAALVDEASNALITAIEQAGDAAQRARALTALEELHPLPLTGLLTASPDATHGGRRDADDGDTT